MSFVFARPRMRPLRKKKGTHVMMIDKTRHEIGHRQYVSLANCPHITLPLLCHGQFFLSFFLIPIIIYHTYIHRTTYVQYSQLHQATNQPTNPARSTSSHTLSSPEYRIRIRDNNQLINRSLIFGSRSMSVGKKERKVPKWGTTAGVQGVSRRTGQLPSRSNTGCFTLSFLRLSLRVLQCGGQMTRCLLEGRQSTKAKRAAGDEKLVS
ncbi:hypothetical protein K504DRAFT_19374 [Pleomassaria siparia CBS 279.74]|uniref:Uncharacterized protein n=1 Tax=Pleomassaria siparia CBS 279.74 TaxID=1314801 RepID=A0A6G1KQP5_9PLEO|nr:hypothetical protein K504DRAFT_19374 [Pleomassaria siparia CBS 279.74]